MIDFQKLVKAGVHFGHQTSRWNPKMAPFIWGFKNKVHLIDVSKTAYQLEKAAEFLKKVTSEGKTVLWVGSKKPAQEVIERVGKETGMPYVKNRWIGGTLSNFGQVKKAVTKLLHYEDILNKTEQFPHYTKKEFNVFKKTAERLEKSVGGIRTLKWPVGAIVLVDVSKEFSALKEANVMGIPVVALVDTNCDPSLVDFVIPGNDDAVPPIDLILQELADAVNRGKLAAKNRDVAQAEVVAMSAEAGDQPLLLEADELSAEEVTARNAKQKAAVAKRPVNKKPFKQAVGKDSDKLEAPVSGKPEDTE
jgi:small subunit ribosomal protein S2